MKKQLPVLLFSLLALLLLEGFLFGFCTDDPFITFRYADNLAHGKGLVFNPGDRVEGYSNFLFVLVMAFFSHVGVAGLGMLIAAKSVGIASSIGLLVLMYYAVIRFEQKSCFIAGGVVLLLASNGLFATWMAGGLETGMFTLLLYAGIVCRSRELEKAGIPYSAFLLGLLAITRPEGILFFSTFLMASIYWYYKNSIPAKRIWFLISADIFIFLSIAGTFEVWRISYYHDLLPNTFYSKATGSLRGRLLGGTTYVVKAAITTIMAIPFLFLKNTRQNPFRIISLCSLLTGIFFIFYAGGDWMPALRFFVPLVPALYFLAVAKAYDYLPRFSAGSARTGIIYSVILFLNFSLTMYYVKTESTMLREPSIGNFYHRHEFPLWDKYSAVAYKIKNTTSDTAVIALGEAGVIPFVCGRKIIDMVGLNDRHIARQKGPDQFSKQTDCEYIMDRADYVLLSQARIENGTIESNSKYATDLLANQKFINSYCLEWQDSMFFMFHRCK